MEIINNFLKEKDFLNINKVMTNNTFPWFITWGINYKHENNYQFSHNFYDNYIFNSYYSSLLEPFLLILNPKAILRIKANLLIKTEKIIKHGFHVDNEARNCKTAIFYINTNNGFTEFEDGTISNSEENKLVIFDSNIKHSGTTCTDKDFRVVLNFNYFK
jgi:hypothetical protein